MRAGVSETELVRQWLSDLSNLMTMCLMTPRIIGEIGELIIQKRCNLHMGHNDAIHTTHKTPRPDHPVGTQ